MENFAGKIAIVTGSSSGIGAGLSKELVKRGCIVIGLARRKEKMQELKEDMNRLPETYKGEYYPYRCDITDEKQMTETFADIEKNHGVPSILINNAGVAIVNPLSELDGDSFDTTINTNAKGLLFATKWAVELMSKNMTAGHILNVNSISGHYLPWSDNLLAYFGSKHMARIFAEGIREMVTENKWNIKISNVSPGMVRTEGVKDYSQYPEVIPLTVEDIVRACVTILDTPPNVLISELIIMPIHQFVRQLPGKA